MQLLKPSPHQAPYGLQAMAMVARAAENGLGEHQRELLNAAQHVLLKTDLDIDALEPISPEELARQITEPPLRRQLIQGMVVMSLVEGPASEEAAKLVRAFATALDVEEPAVKVIQDLAEKQLLLFRLDFWRRSHVIDYFESTYRMNGGILGAAKAILGMKGLVEDRELAARFQALGDLPEDTLGFSFYRHCRDHGFAFPGEKGGMPLGGAWHDFAHGLSDNPPTPEGELRVAAFQAGAQNSERAYFTILFVVLTFTAGINMTPFEQPMKLGRLGQEGLAETVLKELERGSKVTVDLGDAWDFWPYVTMPLEQARERLGIVAKDAPSADQA